MTTTPTPVERAAAALHADCGPEFTAEYDDLEPETQAQWRGYAQHALAAALDVDEIARVLAKHSDYGSAGRGWTCVCGEPLADGSASASDLFRAHQAAALIEHLTGVTR